MIKVPSKEDIKRNEKRWKKIHEILRADVRAQLKDKFAPITPAEKKLFKLLLDQNEFCGNISTWKPTRAAEEKIVKLGLIEDGFVIGGFREWLAEDLKGHILDNEISKARDILKQFDPKVFEDLDSYL